MNVTRPPYPPVPTLTMRQRLDCRMTGVRCGEWPWLELFGIDYPRPRRQQKATRWYVITLILLVLLAECFA